MTAEIGILNRSGVALATDSAVTIGSKKVYNTANKLFALSKFHPVGIMIYGGASFMGVPWETVIKTYRENLGDEKKDNLETYKDDFVSYISQDSRLKDFKSQQVIVYRTFNELLNIVVNEVQSYVDKSLSDGTRPAEEDVTLKLNSLLERKIVELQKNYSKIIELDRDSFIKDFKKVLDGVIKDKVLLDYDQITEDLMISLAHESITRNYFSSGYSGVIISGYGEEELFPSLYELKVEGFISGQLKVEEGDKCIIKPSRMEEGDTTAAVIPFAQKEMVYTFMRGIDPSLNNTIQNLIGGVFSDIAKIIQDNTDISFEATEVLDLKKWGKAFGTTINNSIEDHLMTKYAGPVIDIVDHLPKEELAEMAEALVNLTSFKRRVSIDTETVGGPIDVAVITKGDGLVWIKRKHYFDPEINHTFFRNYQRSDF